MPSTSQPASPSAGRPVVPHIAGSSSHLPAVARSGSYLPGLAAATPPLQGPTFHALHSRSSPAVNGLLGSFGSPSGTSAPRGNGASFARSVSPESDHPPPPRGPSGFGSQHPSLVLPNGLATGAVSRTGSMREAGEAQAEVPLQLGLSNLYHASSSDVTDDSGAPGRAGSMSPDREGRGVPSQGSAVTLSNRSSIRGPVVASVPTSVQGSAVALDVLARGLAAHDRLGAVPSPYHGPVSGSLPSISPGPRQLPPLGGSQPYLSPPGRASLAPVPSQHSPNQQPSLSSAQPTYHTLTRAGGLAHPGLSILSTTSSQSTSAGIGSQGTLGSGPSRHIASVTPATPVVVPAGGAHAPGSIGSSFATSPGMLGPGGMRQSSVSINTASVASFHASSTRTGTGTNTNSGSVRTDGPTGTGTSPALSQNTGQGSSLSGASFQVPHMVPPVFSSFTGGQVTSLEIGGGSFHPGNSNMSPGGQGQPAREGSHGSMSGHMPDQEYRALLQQATQLQLQLSPADFEVLGDEILGRGVSSVVRPLRRISDGAVFAGKELSTRSADNRVFFQRELLLLVRRAQVHAAPAAAIPDSGSFRISNFSASASGSRAARTHTDDAGSEGTGSDVSSEYSEEDGNMTCVVDVAGYIPQALGSIVVVMEMLTGSLSDLPPMPESIALAVAAQMLVGVHYMHTTLGFLHRDIKPGNFLFSSDGGQVKLADFGLACPLEFPAGTCREFYGTQTYFSPERLRGHSYSYPSDVWALGLSIAGIALGHHPFREFLAGVDAVSRYWRMMELLRLDDDGDPSMSTASDSHSDVGNLRAGPRTRTELALQERGMSEDFRLLVLRCLAQKPDERPTCGQLFMDPIWHTAATQEELATWLQQAVPARQFAQQAGAAPDGAAPAPESVSGSAGDSVGPRAATRLAGSTVDSAAESAADSPPRSAVGEPDRGPKQTIRSEA